MKTLVNKKGLINIFASSPISDDRSTSKYLIGIACTVLLVLSIPMWIGLWKLWFSSENLNGLFFVPILSGILLFKQKEEIGSTKPCVTGFLLAVLTVLSMTLALYFKEIKIAGFFFSISLFLLCIGHFGKNAIKTFGAPILFLSVMIPPGDTFVEMATLCLQHIHVFIMDLFYSRLSSANLYLGCDQFMLRFQNNQIITVAAECSGIRSLIGLFMMSSFYGLLDKIGPAKIFILLVFSFIVSVLLNFGRILITTELKLNGYDHYTVGSWHGFLGLFVLLIGIGIAYKFSKFIKRYELKRYEVLNDQ